MNKPRFSYVLEPVEGSANEYMVFLRFKSSHEFGAQPVGRGYGQTPLQALEDFLKTEIEVRTAELRALHEGRLPFSTAHTKLGIGL